MSKPEFVYVTYIETTPEKLWEALTSSEFTRRYWWDTSIVSDWKVGSSFKLVTGGITTDDGEVLEAAVVSLDHPVPGDRVTVDIDPDGIVPLP